MPEDCGDSKVIRLLGIIPEEEITELTHIMYELYPGATFIIEGANTEKQYRFSAELARCDSQVMRKVLQGSVRMFLHLRKTNI